MKMQLFLLLLLAGIARAEMGNPKDIPEAGRVRIDGRLDEWRNVEWTPLTQTLGGNPANISNAQWSIQWNDDPALFIAVRYDDADPVLGTGTNLQDCVKIYVRGDNGSEPLDYSKDQVSAQQYIFGLCKDKVTVWKKLANTNPFPLHNPATAVITLSGNTFTYEIRIPLYDKFCAASERNTQTTEAVEELEVGIDIAIVDVSSTGYAGLKSENTLPNKGHNADAIAEHTLGE
jgi:hypothetical protein